MKRILIMVFMVGFLGFSGSSQNDSIVNPLDSIKPIESLTQDSLGNYVITETNIFPDSTQSSNIRTLADSLSTLVFLNRQIIEKTELINQSRQNLKGHRGRITTLLSLIRRDAILLDLYKKQRLKLIQVRQQHIGGG